MHPTVADLQTLCLPAHGDFKTAITAADAAGWSKPGGDAASQPVQHMRLKTVGTDKRIITTYHRWDTLLTGERVTMDLCSVMVLPAAGDPAASVRDIMGAEPSEQHDGHSVWQFVDRDGRRELLAGTPQALVGALKQGTVLSIDVWRDANKTSALYSEIHMAAPIFPPSTGAGDAATARYRALLAKITPEAKPADWTALRLAFAETPDFAAIDERLPAIHDELIRSATAHDNRSVVALSETVLASDPVDGFAHVAAFNAYGELKDMQAVSPHMAASLRIYFSIIETDGLKPETARVVISEREEDFVALFEHRKITARQRAHIGEHDYDLVETINGKGEKAAYYFQIDRIVAREKARGGGK